MSVLTCGWCDHPPHVGTCEVDANIDGNHPGAVCGCEVCDLIVDENDQVVYDGMPKE